jgi:sulfoxide reductase heme-binding subunit YedZ
MNRDWRVRWVVKPMVFVAALIPLALLLMRAVNNDLGANPIETINRYTGDWVLRFLLVTLSVTPLRKLSGWHWPMRLRRMLGLYAFFYVCLHFLSWVWLDQYFQWDAIVADVIKRPFITLGFACFLLLIPLAATSTNAAVRRLGGRRWQQLHRLVYPIAIGGVVHFLWLVKSDITQPLIYGTLLGLLLGFRLWDWRRRRAVLPAVPAAARGLS